MNAPLVVRAVAPVVAAASEAASSGSLSSVATEIFTIAGEALKMVTGNPILLVFFGSGIVGIAVGTIRKLKKT